MKTELFWAFPTSVPFPHPSSVSQMLFPSQMEEIISISLQGCCSCAPSYGGGFGLVYCGSTQPGVKGRDYRLQWLYLLPQVMDHPSVTPRVNWVPLVHLATLSIDHCKPCSLVSATIATNSPQLRRPGMVVNVSLTPTIGTGQCHTSWWCLFTCRAAYGEISSRLAFAD